MNRPAVILLSLVPLLLASCREARNEVKLGLNLELTGDIRTVGQSSLDGVSLFVRQLNEAGGLDIAGQKYFFWTVVRDNGAHPAQAAEMAQQLVTSDGVLAMIGPNSGACAEAAAVVAEKLKCVLISPWSASPATTIEQKTGAARRYVFRAGSPDPWQGAVAAGFALRTLGATRAAVVYDKNSPASVAEWELFRRAFTESGGTIVSAEALRPADEPAVTDALVSASPEVVFLPLDARDAALLLPALRSAGVEAPVVGLDAWISPQLADTAGDFLEPAYLTAHFSPDSATPEARRFVADFTSAYGRPPDEAAALAYDACGLIVTAIGTSGRIDREAVREAMARMENYRGVTGEFRFVPGSGDPRKSAAVLQFRSGAWRWVENATPPLPE